MGVKVVVYLHMVPSLILRSYFVFIFLSLFFFLFFSCSSMFLYTFRRKSLIVSSVVCAFLIAIFHSAGCLDPNVLTWTSRIYYFLSLYNKNVNISIFASSHPRILSKCACHTSNMYSMAIVISIADVSLAFVSLLSPCLAMPCNLFNANRSCNFPNDISPSDGVVEINEGSHIPLCSFGTSAC